MSDRYFEITGVIKCKSLTFEDELDVLLLITDLLSEYDMEFSGGFEEDIPKKVKYPKKK